jgi:hypothetical protein
VNYKFPKVSLCEKVKLEGLNRSADPNIMFWGGIRRNKALRVPSGCQPSLLAAWSLVEIFAKKTLFLRKNLLRWGHEHSFSRFFHFIKNF